jgi:hypothetical protein
VKKTIYKNQPAMVDTTELYRELMALAGVMEDRRLAEKIYKAVRQLQALDQLAKGEPG